MPSQEKEFTEEGDAMVTHRYMKLGDSTAYVGTASIQGNGEWTNGTFFSYNGYLSNEATKHSQPDDRITGSVGYKNIARLSLGYVNPYQARLTLNGEQLLGIELNLRTSSELFRFDIAAGRTQFAIAPWVSDPDSLQALPDTSTHNDSMLYWAPGTYERDILAGRIGVGTGDIHQWGLSFLKGKDLRSSMRQIVMNLGADSLGETSALGYAPEDNFVIGSDYLLRLFQGAWQVSVDGAFSMFTADTRMGIESLGSDMDPATKTLLENLAPIIEFNTGTTPKPVNAAGDIEPKNGKASTALDAKSTLSLEFSGLRSRTIVGGQRIGSSFKSMGNPWVSVDRLGYELSEQVENDLLFGRVSWRDFRDNLENAKAATSAYRNVNADIGMYASATRPGLDLNYIGQYTTIDQYSLIASDSISVAAEGSDPAGRYNKSHILSASVQPRFIIGSIQNQASLSASWAGFFMEDQNQVYSENMNATLNASMALSQKSAPWNLRGGYSHSFVLSEEGVGFWSPSIGIGYKWFEDRLHVSLDYTYQRQVFLQSVALPEGRNFGGKLGVRIIPYKNHMINLSSNLDHRSEQKDPDYRFQGDYAFRF
jgi:hypothetical protein